MRIKINHKTQGLFILALSSWVLTTLPAHAKMSPVMFKDVTAYFNAQKDFYSPTLGAAALEAGLIYNLRFYGNFERGIKEGGGRVYIADKGLDDLSKILRILFPSSSGNLATETAAESANFGKALKSPTPVALLLNFAHQCRMSGGKCDAVLTAKLIKTEMKAKARNKTLKVEISELVDSIKLSIENESKSIYPVYMTEMVINAFFVQHFNLRDDIWHLLEGLDDEIVNKALFAKTTLQDFKANILNQDTFKTYFNDLAEEERKEPILEIDPIFAVATSDIWYSQIPYRQSNDLISHGNALPYDRMKNESGGQTFADCTETAFRHLLQMLLFDAGKKAFDLASIKSFVGEAHQKTTYFRNFEDYFTGLPVTAANAGDQETRSWWNKVMGDLNGGEFPILDEVNKILYGKETNELHPGFINFLKVFYRIFGFALTLPNPWDNLSTKKHWLKEALSDLFTKINPTKKYEFDLEQVNAVIQGAHLAPELEGNLTVHVSEGKKELYSYKIYTKKGEHCDVNIEKHHVESIDWWQMIFGYKHLDFRQMGTAKEVLLLVPQRFDLLTTVQHPLLRLFSTFLSNDGARINFLKTLDANLSQNRHWFGDDKVLLILLTNVLQDIAWQNQQTKDAVAVSIIKLSVFEALKNGLDAHVPKDMFKNDSYENDSSLENRINRLKKLSLNNNNSVDELSLDGTLHGLQALAQIDLRGSLVKDISLKNLPHLTKLDLSSLSTLRDVSMESLTALERVEFTGSSVKEVHFKNLSRLAELDLSYLRSLLSVVLVDLNALDRLDLSGSSLKNVHLTNLPNLTELVLSRQSVSILTLEGLNKLAQIPLMGSSVKEVYFKNLPRLRRLDLGNLELLSHVSLDNLSNLSEIRLIGSSVKEVRLKNLPGLVDLNLDYTGELFELIVENLPKLEFEIAGSSLKKVNGSNLTNSRRIKF